LPAFIERLARHSLRLRGFRSVRVRTSVGRMHVLDARGGGHLPPTVLLHGFSSAGVDFLPLLQRLRPRVSRILAPDMPGHGFSDTPREGLNPRTMRAGLLEALDAVIDEPVVLFGNSMGGLAAIHYALARPEKVRGIVLCSPGGAAMNEAELATFLDTFRVERHRDALRFVDRLLAEPNVLRQVLAWGVRRKFSHPNMRSLLASVSSDDLLRPEELSALVAPVLLLWGAVERILPRAHLDFFREHLPAHAHVDEPEGFGHSPYLERPGAVTRRIVDFLHEVDVGGSHRAA